MSGSIYAHTCVTMSLWRVWGVMLSTSPNPHYSTLFKWILPNYAPHYMYYKLTIDGTVKYTILGKNSMVFISSKRFLFTFLYDENCILDFSYHHLLFVFHTLSKSKFKFYYFYKNIHPYTLVSKISKILVKVIGFF